MTSYVERKEPVYHFTFVKDGKPLQEVLVDPNNGFKLGLATRDRDGNLKNFSFNTFFEINLGEDEEKKKDKGLLATPPKVLSFESLPPEAFLNSQTKKSLNLNNLLDTEIFAVQLLDRLHLDHQDGK